MTPAVCIHTNDIRGNGTARYKLSVLLDCWLEEGAMDTTSGQHHEGEGGDSKVAR
jgi:hypothetical protein